MTDTAFIFKKWKTRIPYHGLMKLDEDKICALGVIWGATRSKRVRAALVAILVPHLLS